MSVTFEPPEVKSYGATELKGSFKYNDLPSVG